MAPDVPGRPRPTALAPLAPVRVDAVELHRVSLPRPDPFVTAHGRIDTRDAVVVRVVLADGALGWAECAALPEPTYSEEYVDGAWDVLVRHLVPRLLALDAVEPSRVAEALAAVQGHAMAKAALDTAVLDAALRAEHGNLARWLGVDPGQARVPSGVALGVQPTAAALLDAVDAAAQAGYRRVKCKVAGRADVAAIAEVRRAFPELVLLVDANEALDPASAAAFDGLGLAAIEQPLPRGDVDGLVALATRLVTPVALDESLRSVADADRLLRAGAGGVAVAKNARLGGVRAGVALHDVCRAGGYGLYVGGMLSSGLGRAVDLALAALPGCTLPGDCAPSARYGDVDLVTEPTVLGPDGCLAVPDGPGLGVEVDRETLARVRTAHHVVRR